MVTGVLGAFGIQLCHMTVWRDVQALAAIRSLPAPPLGVRVLGVDGYWQQEREERLMETLLRRRVDGLIVLGGSLPAEKLQETARQVPLIIFGREVPGLESQCLQLDDFDGAHRATEHLIAMGHRRIAHVTGNLGHADAVARREGYLQALRHNRLEPIPELVVEGEYTEQSGLLAMEMLFGRGRTFSAVFAANDESAYGVRLALYDTCDKFMSTNVTNRQLLYSEIMTRVGHPEEVPDAVQESSVRRSRTNGGGG